MEPAKAVTMLEFGNRLRCAKVVRRRSGPGFRLVLSLITLTGMPVLETITKPFDTVDAAYAYAKSELDADPLMIVRDV